MTTGIHGVADDLLEEARLLWTRLSSDSSCVTSRVGPDAALAVVEPVLAQFGITRVGDLTDLDTVGIPVWFACRPNSRALSVGQGKGLTADQARISAIMEAVEGFAAERTKPLVDRFGSLLEMKRRDAPTIPLARMHRVNTACLDMHRERAWVSGISLRDGRTVFAPYELVGLDMRSDMPWDHATFRMGSVGLAAGIDVEHAALHALLEIVENDASAPVEFFGPQRTYARPLHYRAGESVALDTAVGMLANADVPVHFVWLPGAVDLPVVGAYVGWRAPPARPRWCSGFACRSDPLDAALAALLEAVQARLTNIAGARDDIAPGTYSATARWQFGTDDARTIGELRQEFGGTVGASVPVGLTHVLRMAFRAGIDDIALFPLGMADTSIRVVRLLATDLSAVPSAGMMPLGARILPRARTGAAA